MNYTELQNRVIAEARYMVKHRCTVRKAGTHFNLSKSTIYLDVTKRLKKMDPKLAKKVKNVLQENKANRHIRGGMATKKKYLNMAKKLSP